MKVMQNSLINNYCWKITTCVYMLIQLWHVLCSWSVWFAQMCFNDPFVRHHRYVLSDIVQAALFSKGLALFLHTHDFHANLIQVESSSWSSAIACVAGSFCAFWFLIWSFFLFQDFRHCLHTCLNVDLMYGQCILQIASWYYALLSYTAIISKIWKPIRIFKS